MCTFFLSNIHIDAFQKEQSLQENNVSRECKSLANVSHR